MECVHGIFNTVAKLKKVLVAVVEGVTVGIGTTILLHCDIVIASGKTKFRVPFVNLGVGPEGSSSVLLPRAIGQKMAEEYIILLLQQPLASLLATKEIMRASQPDVETVINEELKAFKELVQMDETRDRINALLRR